MPLRKLRLKSIRRVSLKDLERQRSNVTAATERLQATQNTLAYGERMFRKGYITPQQLEAQKSAVARAKLDLGQLR